VQVSPESQYSTGTGPDSACGGRNTENFISHEHVSEAWLNILVQPPKVLFAPRDSRVVVVTICLRES
jgi:hypothetical protein